MQVVEVFTFSKSFDHSVTGYAVFQIPGLKCFKFRLVLGKPLLLQNGEQTE